MSLLDNVKTANQQLQTNGSVAPATKKFAQAVSAWADEVDGKLKQTAASSLVDLLSQDVTDMEKRLAALEQPAPTDPPVDPPPVVPPAAPSRPFADTSAFNTKIPLSPPIHPDSSVMLSAQTDFLLAGDPVLDPYKEWVGPRPRIVFWKGDTSKLPLVDVYVNYVDYQGYACATTPRKIPMPPNVQPTLPSASIDRIVWIVDENTGDVWEGYGVSFPGEPSRDITTCPPNRWNAVRFDHFPAEEKTGVGYGHGISASGSGIHVGAGVLRIEDFDDLSVGSVIPHAIRMNWWCGSNGVTYPVFKSPATSGDGRQAKGVPMGARVQLDPAVDVETWPSVQAKPEPWRSGLKKILRTLQIYGCIGVDTSGGRGGGGLEACHPASVAPRIYPWDMNGVGWSYANGIPYDLMSKFRVIDFREWTGA